MARVTIHFCDICHTPLHADSSVITKSHGLALDWTISKGGWGHAMKQIDFTGVVCETCFDEVSDAMQDVVQLINDRRRGARRFDPNQLSLVK